MAGEWKARVPCAMVRQAQRVGTLPVSIGDHERLIESDYTRSE
jgi:hypothetical protein